MLFRANASNNDEPADQDLLAARQEHMRNSRDATKKHDAVDPRAEEDGDRQQPDANTMSRLNGVDSHSTPLSLPTSAQSSSKFHSLKRKLFPSRMRTALPTRIPPLVTSPISVSTLAAAEAELDATLRSNCSNQHTPVTPEPQSTYTRPLKPRREEVAGSTATISNEDEDDDDDLELEIAIENLDTGTEQDTLNEVGPACFTAIAVATSLVSLVTIC